MSTYYQDETVTLLHGDSLEQARTLPGGSVDCIVTSPPYYGLRDYGSDGQYGLEDSSAEYVETMRALFSELRRTLADDGTLWLNIGDSYSNTGGSGSPSSSSTLSGNGHVGGGPKQKALPKTETRRDGLPSKNLLGIPWRLAFALQNDGWILRNAIIWHKPNAMPESVQDRLNCRYETVFMFSKSQRYWYDLDPIREELTYPDTADGTRVFGGKNKGNHGGIGATERRRGGKPWTRTTATPETASGTRATAEVLVMDADSLQKTADGTPAPAPITSKADRPNGPRGKNPGDVWSINTQPFPGAHFAVFPKELARRCIVAGCKPGGTVLDPFSGSGTTGLVAQENGRKYIGIDISAAYLKLSLETRLQNATLDFGGAA